MSRTLVAFFSASGQTKRFSWRNSQTSQLWYLWNKTESSIQRKWFRFSRSTIECKNRKSRPELADKNANISKYNTIIVGFPVWWYIAPNIILIFLESYNFTGKKLLFGELLGQVVWEILLKKFEILLKEQMLLKVLYLIKIIEILLIIENLSQI